MKEKTHKLDITVKEWKLCTGCSLESDTPQINKSFLQHRDLRWGVDIDLNSVPPAGPTLIVT